MNEGLSIRTIYDTDEFRAFIDSADERIKKKIEYILGILRTQEIINSNIAKKLVNTDLYELRIKVDNEYRILTYTIDHEDINQAKNILLISSFMKKSTKDYNKEITRALKILEQWIDQE